MRKSVVWIYGLSGAGKTTLAKGIVSRIPRARLVDADEIRAGLNSDLGYSLVDRAENIRRLACLAAWLADQGDLPVVTAVSPVTEIRRSADLVLYPRKILWMRADCPLDICQQRDTKGLYKSASSGQQIRLTGVQQLFEAGPELPIRTHNVSVDTSIELAMERISASVDC